MEDISQSHYNYISSYSTAQSSTLWFSALSFAPCPLYGTLPDQELVLGSLSTVAAEGLGCSTEFPHVAAHHLSANSDSIYGFGAHTDSDTRALAAGMEAYQVPTFSAVEGDLAALWEFSLNHPATTQENKTRDSLVESENRSYEIIPQDVYRKGRRTAHIIPRIQYQGFSLNRASKRDYRDLMGADIPAWSDDISVGAKLAIVFCFPGKPQYHRQVHVRRTNFTALTRGKLANIVAREIQAYLGKLQESNHGPIKHRGADIELENLVLIDVRHVSKGSLQPTIGIVTKYS